MQPDSPFALSDRNHVRNINPPTMKCLYFLYKDKKKRQGRDQILYPMRGHIQNIGKPSSGVWVPTIGSFINGIYLTRRCWVKPVLPGGDVHWHPKTTRPSSPSSDPATNHASMCLATGLKYDTLTLRSLAGKLFQKIKKRPDQIVNAQDGIGLILL